MDPILLSKCTSNLSTSNVLPSETISKCTSNLTGSNKESSFISKNSSLTIFGSLLFNTLQIFLEIKVLIHTNPSHYVVEEGYTSKGCLFKSYLNKSGMINCTHRLFCSDT